ncbi:integumentary mucin C.1-like [Pundamilia nyererei]|uniref:Integumentary mucin C.1-like n=1 Tax=Pundamilia nyererei TaxID=303518 RepID=A0A9Y3RIU8_9CICH|nr:PREDICTED: integumentary mucin C.1-like [Pundamilia nyererei]
MNPSTTPATANGTNATSNAATTLGSNTTAATTVGSNTTAATTVVSNTTAATTVSPNTTTTSTTVTTLPTTTTSTASTDPPTASQGALGLIFSLSETFTADLANRSSSAFQTLAQKVTNEVNAACKRVYRSSFLRSFVKSFRSGSVVTDMTLVFQDKASVPTVNNLTSELSTNINTSSLNIIPGSLNATVLNITTTPTTASNITTAATTAATTVGSNTTAATTVSPNTTTTSTTVTTLPTTTTSTASTDPPSANEGTLGLQFSLNQTFKTDLSVPSSSAFQTLAQTVIKEINRLVKNVFASFLRSRVNSFKNGSVVVDMTLVFQDQNSVSSLTNATAALTQALQNTALGIIEGSIRVSSSTSLQSTIGIWALTLLTVAQIMINM